MSLSQGHVRLRSSLLLAAIFVALFGAILILAAQEGLRGEIPARGSAPAVAGESARRRGRAGVVAGIGLLALSAGMLRLRRDV